MTSTPEPPKDAPSPHLQLRSARYAAAALYREYGMGGCIAEAYWMLFGLDAAVAEFGREAMSFVSADLGPGGDGLDRWLEEFDPAEQALGAGDRAILRLAAQAIPEAREAVLADPTLARHLATVDAILGGGPEGWGTYPGPTQRARIAWLEGRVSKLTDDVGELSSWMTTIVTSPLNDEDRERLLARYGKADEPDSMTGPPFTAAKPEPDPLDFRDPIRKTKGSDALPTGYRIATIAGGYQAEHPGDGWVGPPRTSDVEAQKDAHDRAPWSYARHVLANGHGP